MAKVAKEPRNIFRIDPNRLDRECVLHVADVHKLMCQLADAKLALAEAEQTYVAVKAELDAKVRKNPEKFKLMKITEVAVQNAMRNSSDYQEAKELRDKCLYDVDIIQAGVTALNHKRDMLKGLITLYSMDYYAEVTADREEIESINKTASRSKGGVR